MATGERAGEVNAATFVEVGDRAVLVGFGDVPDDATLGAVLALDRALLDDPPAGLDEVVPGQINLLVVFDPLATDHRRVSDHVRGLIDVGGATLPPGRSCEIEVCYDDDLAPDLDEIATRTGLSAAAVIDAHLAGELRVLMYGFAPGYAYLGGLADSIRLPRKEAAVRDVPAGTAIIAGHQALITTLDMPTGWWRVGRSPTLLLPHDLNDPFPLEPADRVRFVRIDRDTYEQRRRAPQPPVVLEGLS